MTAMATPKVFVVMGVSGSGKSTVAAALAERLGCDLAEGDHLHPVENVAKMAAGQPLTDDDRWPWLATVADWIDARTAVGGVVSCSALKRAYRDRLRGDHVTFVFLRGDRAAIAARLAARRDHFMPAALLDSQFAALEPPAADEQFIDVDIATLVTTDEQVDAVIAAASM
ncbi:MAG TPA: gluconokinase [Ilumatobacter sp.]|nr:gluconokinase [Ilumatobacter sp.]